MPYQPLKRPPKGAWSRHLQEQRKLLNLSQTQAFLRVYERIGWAETSRTAYCAIDNGVRPPSPKQVEVLGKEFGWPPDVEEPEPLEISEQLGEIIKMLRLITDRIVRKPAEQETIEGAALQGASLLRDTGLPIEIDPSWSAAERSSDAPPARPVPEPSLSRKRGA